MSQGSWDPVSYGQEDRSLFQPSVRKDNRNGLSKKQLWSGKFLKEKEEDTGLYGTQPVFPSSLYILQNVAWLFGENNKKLNLVLLLKGQIEPINMESLSQVIIHGLWSNYCAVIVHPLRIHFSRIFTCYFRNSCPVKMNPCLLSVTHNLFYNKHDCRSL